jgi:hypothetical protein
LRRSIGIVIFTLVATLTIEAQGTVSGRVTDPYGSVWPGAKITLSQESDKQGSDKKEEEIQRTTTNHKGEYSFANVPFGILRLRVTVSGINREFSTRIELNSKEPARSDVVFSFTPCSDEEEHADPKITTADHVEIVRSLVDILIGDTALQPEDRRIILSPGNFSPDWLSAEQRSRLAILPRGEIQEITERTGTLTYYRITKPVQRGGCVGISLVYNLTIKGQMEDANMAGGEDTYEFRKVDGKWTWLHLSSTIS